MTFNSLSFVVFFCAVLGVYYALPSWRARKSCLVAASFVFYAAWDVRYLVLLWATLGLSWWTTNRIHRETDAARRRSRLVWSITAYVGLLALFKFAGPIESVLGLGSLGVVLPLGISFYLFQAIAYTVDVYRKTSKPAESLLDYALYFAFFPHLAMGPIVRPNEFLPQCQEAPAFSVERFFSGLSMITIGLFSKIVLADGFLGLTADGAFAAGGSGGMIEAWTGATAYTCELFFDFSGYTMIALGTAHCFGFTLPGNFNLPFGAIGFNDFWRRWHISLSRWIRDYLYLPLSTRLIVFSRSRLSRAGYARLRPLVALTSAVITMGLAGLWHGAHLIMIAWGLLHALYLIVEHLAVRRPGLRRYGSGPLARALLLVLTFVLVCIAMTVFHSTDLTQAGHMLGAMFGGAPTTSFLGIRPGHIVLTADVVVAWTLVMITVTSHAALRNTTFMRFWSDRSAWVRALALGVMLALIAIADSSHATFAYFQF